MEKDFYSNSFFSDNERYADIINGFGCNGTVFVKGKDLQELDSKVYRGRMKGRLCRYGRLSEENGKA